MAHSGWPEVRRRVALVAAAAAVLGTAYVVATPDFDGPAGSGRAAGAGGSGPALVLAAEESGVRAVDVDLDGELEPAGAGTWRTGRLDAATFSMLGLTWQGQPVDARVRVRPAGARTWQPWQPLEDLADGPDLGARERRLDLRATDLQWTGPADGVQVEVVGPRPADASLALIAADPDPAAGRAETVAKPRASVDRRPTIRNRGVWGADPSLRSGRPTYNRTIQQVHVHHTVNSNGYSRADVPGLLRGIYRYHTQNLGWSDVGYNFLVDRFGRTWLGRAGGAARAVRGAHTLGFNSTSTGVAVIGNFETARPGKRVVTALVQLAAWKLARYDRAPRGHVDVYSHGSDSYAAGRTVRLPVIDGHRDTSQTACPGRHLYDLIPRIRDRAADRVARF